MSGGRSPASLTAPAGPRLRTGCRHRRGPGAPARCRVTLVVALLTLIAGLVARSFARPPTRLLLVGTVVALAGAAVGNVLVPAFKRAFPTTVGPSVMMRMPRRVRRDGRGPGVGPDRGERPAVLFYLARRVKGWSLSSPSCPGWSCSSTAPGSTAASAASQLGAGWRPPGHRARGLRWHPVDAGVRAVRVGAADVSRCRPQRATYAGSLNGLIAAFGIAGIVTPRRRPVGDLRPVGSLSGDPQRRLPAGSSGQRRRCRGSRRPARR